MHEREWLIERSIPEPNTGCWLWLGARDADGYGRQTTFPRRSQLAHRASYQMFVGGIAPGLQVDHLCRVRCCVNPKHLEAVTPRENTLRSNGITALKARQIECKWGHPLIGSNVRVNEKGQRNCRICMRRNVAEYYARHKTKAS